jgi:Na+:H+ antiporter
VSNDVAAMHGDPIAPVILGVTSILFFAVVGRILARRVGQPTVLGELLMGILLGNAAWYFGFDLITVLREGARIFDITQYTLSGMSISDAATAIFGDAASGDIVRILSGPSGAEILQVAHTVDVFSRYGVIFLLFMVGLETDLLDMRRVGPQSVRVAIIGVLVPFLLGYTVALLLLPQFDFSVRLFVAATLGATSVGITAKVLQEMDKLGSSEGAIVLGAAVADDVLMLMVLAVVSGVAVSGSVNLVEVARVFVLSGLFLAGAFYLGPLIVRGSARIMGKLDIVEAKMFTSYLFVMVLAWVANLAGLATIIGAFAAGLILSDSYFGDDGQNGAESEANFSIRWLIMPLEVILVPIFFILMGIQVKLESFASWHVIAVAAALLVAAIAGKLVSGLGAGPGVNRLVIGIGMLPRGEVGLVFAAIGRTLGVIDDALFSSIVLMVIVTSLMTPPLLKIAVGRQPAGEAAGVR